MLSVHEYVSGRMAHAFRQLQRSLEGLTEDAAVAGARPDWPPSRFGAGLDGSIAGIVRHVAVWKHAAAAGLETGRFPEAGTLAPPDDWSRLQAWLAEGHQRLRRLLEAGPGAALEERVVWEGQRMTRLELFSHLIEHDQYHAGQVNLLRQLRNV